ncbi:MAG: 50S ribosomal protein L24 [Candidatus Liptonbacteria bacterium]|nr:50S ribosomal protein L24 [Candidatus Liptonbacteria bacterium]
MKLKKGDIVKILRGKDRGATGKILQAIPTRDRVVVEGANVRKKHSRPRRRGQTGQIVSVTHAIPASAAQIICPSCKKPTRVGYRTDDGTKRRVCRACDGRMD